MSSPIHHSKNVDAVLMYAPPWAREEGRTVPLVPEEGAAEVVQEGGEIDDTERDKSDPEFSGDRAVLELQRRLALNPEMVPEPQPIKGERAGAMVALRFGAVMLVAAFVAWLVVAVPSLRQIRHDHVRTTALAASASGRTSKQSPSPTAAISQPPRQDTRPASNDAPSAAAAKPEVHPAASSAVAAAPPSSAVPATPVIAASAPEKITLRLDDEETAALIKRGQDFLRNGDIASARLLLRRAADAGSAPAALALAETYDAAGIQRLGAIGIQPEPAKARELYERAAQLGSEAASQQLATLAQPPQ